MGELTRAVFAGLAGMIGWGVGDFGAEFSMNKDRFGLKALSEYQATFWLYVITTFLVLAFAILNSRNVPNFSLRLAGELSIAALLNFGAYIFFFRSLRIGNLSTISALFSTYAVGASLVSVFIYGEVLTNLQLVALAVLIVGIMGVAIKDIRNFAFIDGSKEVFAAVVLFSFFFPFWNAIVSKTNPGEEYYLAAAIDIAITFMFLAVTAFVMKQSVSFKPEKQYWVVVFTGVANAFAVLVVTNGYATTSYTSIITVLSAGVPLVASVLDFLVNNIRLTKTQYISIFLVVLGTILLVA